MDLAWVEDFLALAECGNFTRAAERRHVTQPAFSRRIRALESWVGAELFDRSSHRVVTSEAGRAFGAEAAELLRRASLARSLAVEAASGEAQVRIASTHLLSSSFLPGWLGALESAAERSFACHVSVEHMVGCERAMERGEARLLLCHHHDDAPSVLEGAGFVRLTLGRDRLVPVSVADGSGGAWFAIDAGAGGRLAYLAHRPESGLARILERSGLPGRIASRLDPRFASHAALALLTMVRAGRGFSWMPFSVVAREIEAGGLAPAGGPEWEVPIEICLIRARARQSEATEALWQAARTLAEC